MADRKYHWAVPVLDPSKRRYAWKAYAGGHYAQACGRKPALVLGDTAAQFVAKVKTDPDWYCSDCVKAARLALTKESAPKPTPRPARSCSNCRSGAINPGHHGRAEDTDLDLCDVCYWRKRAPEPRPISEARHPPTEVDWKSRVRVERKELNERLAKLTTFLLSAHVAALDPIDRDLLIRQREAMVAYSAILDLRIDRL